MHSYKKVSGMTAEIKITRCYGCGALLQSLNKYEPGFVSQKRTENNENLCDRCFRLRNPDGKNFQTIDTEYSNLIKNAITNDAIFCYIVDAFFWKGSISANLNKLLKGAKIVVIINKIDILPDDINKSYVKEMIEKDFNAQGITPISFEFSSINDDLSNHNLIEKINKLREGKDVYFVGASRVGKSALINEFLKIYDNKTNRTITKQKMENSEIYLTAVPLDQTSTLFDTPGIFDSTSMVNQVEKKTLRYIIPRYKINNNSFPMKEGESLILGGVGIIDYVKGDKADFDLYFSRDIGIVKTKSSKTFAEFNKGISDFSLFPLSSTITSNENLIENKINVPNINKPLFLSIHGLGKLKVVGQGQEISIYLPQGVLVSFDD